jgi:predicted RNase H-like HicB family nuclease
MRTYRIILNQEPEGGYTVIVPSLPGCITYGDNVNHAIDMAKEAIEGYLEVLKEQGYSLALKPILGRFFCSNSCWLAFSNCFMYSKINMILSSWSANLVSNCSNFNNKS